jgi:predicted protein tyrosine phosphatase
LLGSSALAQYSAPADVNSMLAGLKDLKAKATKSSKSQLAQTISDFSNAAASDGAATEFYSQAVWVTQFVGRSHEQTAFHDWKKKEGVKLNATAIRACLRYTVISLQRAAGATDRQIFPVLLAYAQDTSANISAISNDDTVRQPVTNSIFARWYNITDELGGLENWESTPQNVDGIYEKVLLPFMRKSHDQRVIAYWDKKITDETASASNATAEFTADRFNQTRLPELYWSRAEDLLAINLRDQGLTEMYTIIKKFPDHASASKWIDELQRLLTTPTTPVATGTALPAGPATAAH